VVFIESLEKEVPLPESVSQTLLQDETDLTLCLNSMYGLLPVTYSKTFPVKLAVWEPGGMKLLQAK